MFTVLKLQYIDGNSFKDEQGNNKSFIFRGYLSGLIPNQWYYCQVKGITIYEIVPCEKTQ